jgi:hypothetical protein
MEHKHLVIKGLALATVGTYFGYAFYWFVKTIPWIIEISFEPEFYVPATGLRFFDIYSVSLAYLMEYVGFVGLIVRAVGASYSLFTVFLLLKNKKIVFHELQNKISKVLLFEGLYYLCFIPAIALLLLNFSALPNISNILLSAAFSTQIILITPMLTKLAFVIKNYRVKADKPALIRWMGLAYVSIVVAVWVTYILKWREMMAVDPYLFSALSVRILGFLNTVIVQSLGVTFAIVGVFFILRKQGSQKAVRWLGLSAILVSLHIIIYVIYVTYVGITRFIQFGELWLIPLFGVGLYLLFKNPEIN